jgi:[ribosomal protein S5]-alanine N-acetyltransferase
VTTAPDGAGGPATRSAPEEFVLRTGRTEVRPVTLEVAEALLRSDAAFRERFGLDVAAGYLAFPEALPATLGALRSGMPPEWFSHLIIDGERNVVVGLGGFTGPPSDGVVEVGYSVAPAHRGRGHATEAVRLWIDRAARAGVPLVRAHTLAEEGPSTTVLAKLGFTRVAEIDDPEDGPVWRWERTAAR